MTCDCADPVVFGHHHDQRGAVPAFPPCGIVPSDPFPFLDFLGEPRFAAGGMITEDMTERR